MPEEQDDLPLVRELPRRPQPGDAGTRKLRQISTSVGTGWAFVWFVFGPDGGAARWWVGGAGLVLVAAVRIWLHTHGARALDVSHLSLELAQPAVRRGDRVEARLTVLDSSRLKGDLRAAIACAETYDYRVDSDNRGPSRRTRTHELAVRGFVDVLTQLDARTLSVALNFMEESRDYTGVGLIGAHAMLHAGPVGAGSQFPFELVLPPDALPAFPDRGHRRLVEVAAHAERPGFDRHAHLRIDVWSTRMQGVVFPANEADAHFWSRGRGPAGPPGPGW